MDLLILAPVGMLVVMGLLAAIGLPGSRRSWETPPAQPQRQPAANLPQYRGAPGQPTPLGQLPPPPRGYAYQPMPGGQFALVPIGGAR